MKKHFKTLRERGLALFLAFVMCFSLLPAQAMAQDAGTAGAENTYSICDNADNCIQQLQNWLNGKAAGTSISIEVQKNIWFNQTLNIPAGLDVTVYANGGTIRRDTEGGFSCPMFSVPADAKLTLRNVTIESRDKTNNTPDSGASMVVVNGGECVLGSGAKLAEGRFYNGDGPKKGGAVYLDGGKFTMQKGSTIEHCGAKDAGGAVYVAKGEFIAESGATIGECWVGTQKQGTKVYVAEGATFKNDAGIDGVRNANDNLPDQFVDEWLVITILRNNPNGNGIPSEPSTVSGCTWDHLMKSNDGYTIATTGDQWDLTFTKNPAEVVKTEILNSPEYIASTNVNDRSWGVADSTGVKTKKWLNLDEAFWNEYLDVLATENRYQVIDASGVLTDSNKEQYKVVPYVVKYQNNGNNYDGWHIDCAVIPKDSLQLTYNLNLPNGVSTDTSGFGLPLTVIGIPGAETVEAKPVGTLYFNNTQVTPVGFDGTTDNATRIEAKYQNQDITLLFKGWSTTPDGIGQSLYRPGDDASFKETTTLYAQWTQTPPYSIIYNGLENSTFADNNPNPTSYSIVTPTFTLQNPTKEGYKFLGWTGTGLDGATDTVTIEQGSTGDRSYTATWEAIKVTAVPNGGAWQSSLPSNWKGAETSGNKVSELANGSVTLPVAADITKTGLTLAGWKGSDNEDYAPGVSVSPDKDLTVTAQWAGLSITKSADPTSGVKVGEDITYTITVENTGNVDLTDVVVDDTMKTKVTLADGSAWSIGDLARGASKEIKYTYTVATADVTAGKVLNTATAKGKGPNSTELTATSKDVEVKTLGEAKLSVSKSVDKAKANVGDTITYTITVTNSGNGAAEGITLTDTFSGTGRLVWTGIDPTTTAFDVAAKSGDENTVVTFTATYVVVEADKTAGSITNSAVLEGETEPDDPQTEVTVTAPNLTVAKSVSATEANVGDTITYTITVTNSGNGAAEGITLTDTFSGTGRLVWTGIDPTTTAFDVAAKAGETNGSVTFEATYVVLESDKGQTITNSAVLPGETEPDDPQTEVTVTEDPVAKQITYTWVDGHTNTNIEQKTVSEGTVIPESEYPAAPSHESEGYRFVGWTVGAPDTDGNITITANYEPIPAAEKIDVTWVDGHTGDILKELPGVYDKGTTTIPEDQYPSAPAHADYTFEQWTLRVLDNGNIIITANYRTLQVNPDGPSFEDLTNLGIMVDVVCDTNATHAPLTRSYPLMEGSYETIVTNNSCTLIIYNDLYVEAYGGDHSLVGRPAQTIMLEYVGTPAPISDDETAGDETIDAGSNADSEDESTDNVVDNNVDNDADVTTPDAGAEAGSEDSGITDTSSEETSNGNLIDDDSGDEAGAGDGNVDAGLLENDINNDEPIQLMSVEAISFSAPTVTGRWAIAEGYTNTVTFYVRCEEPAARTHTVTWVNWNGDVLQQMDNVANDVNIPSSAYTNATPVRPADAGYTYTFSGWSAPSVDANGNVTYTALYDRTAIVRTHTVTWVNWNGIVLQQMDNVANGVNIPSSAYTNATPVRPADAEYTYTFSGWSAPSVDRDGNVTYVAQYTPSRISGEGPVVPVTPPVTPVTPVTPTPGPTVIPDTPTPLDPGTTITDEDVPLAGAVGLNDVDHFAYIIGYDEDHVRPLNNITRAEVATIFFRLMTDEYRNANWSTSNDFSDVQAGSWYNNAISTCANAGALNGYADGSFKPNASITRAEFAAIAARFLSDEYTDDGTGDFSDTANHWAAKEIRLAAKAGWVRGDGNKFRPNDPITRAEVMTIVNRMLDRVPDADHMLETMKKWVDNPEDAWYYEAVQEATNEHAYERDADLGVIETWTEILEVRDWKALEESWANANT